MNSNRSVIIPPLQYSEHWQLPKIASPLPNVTAFVGDEVRMSCETSGDPAPQVTWFLDEIGIEMLMDDRFTVSEGGEELLITNVNLRDSGTYRCVAANVNGFKSVKGRLSVVGRKFLLLFKDCFCTLSPVMYLPGCLLDG